MLSTSPLYLLVSLAAAQSSIGPVGRAFAGFESVEKFVAFGDSYSRIGFTAENAQPSASNPLGNTVSTSTGGENWVEFLTLTYNESLLFTYDYALSGATVNISIIEASVGRDIVTETQTFLTAYGGNSSFGGYNTIYGFWIGINDIKQSYLGEDWEGVDPSVYTEAIDSYYQVVKKLYETGARDFLFLNVPPLEKSPLVTQSATNSTKYPLMQSAIADYNKKLYKMAKEVRHNLPYTSVFFYDTNTLFNSVIADPSKFQETVSYKDTTSYCKDYASVVNDPAYFSESCDYSLSGYFWLNSLHPTWPVHQLLAKEVAALLNSGESL